MADGAVRLFDVDVRGGRLRVGAWGSGGPVVFAAHGITASHLNFAAIARRLGGLTVLAPDLRGRGGSRSLPGPFGMRSHVEDALAVLDSAGIESAVALGHSMGGYVAAMLAAYFPERVSAVVLVDGGIGLPVPEGISSDELLDSMLGPAVSRLRRTFVSVDAFLAEWQAHPALAGRFNDDVARYLAYDLMPDEEGFRSKVSEAAVRADGADLLISDEVRDAIGRVQCPVRLLRAERGILDQPEPLLPDAVVAYARGMLPSLEDELVAGTNHYTIAFSAVGADAVARAVRSAVRLDAARSGR